MPKISLVVCLYRERNFLERLLSHSQGCYDDLVVVHDGPEGGDTEPDSQKSLFQKPLAPLDSSAWKSPEELSLGRPEAPPLELAIDYAELPPEAPMPTGYRLCVGNPEPGSIHELVVRHGGRFYEGPRCFQQEPHWPFAWWAARNDWILRLDADEFPSDGLREWLMGFRNNQVQQEGVSAFTCIWPLWNGVSQGSHFIPEWRPVFVNRMAISFVGMAEQIPVITGALKQTGLVLNHMPNRKSYGLANLILRRQAYFWRKVISLSIMQSACTMPRWRYSIDHWPYHWEQMKEKPLWTGFKRFVKTFFMDWKHRISGYDRYFAETLGAALHQFLMASSYWYYKHRNILKKK
jgi:hypothetical protein